MYDKTSTFLGTVLVGTTLHHWYGFLARRFPDASIHGALKRLAFDQFFFAPAFIATFMACSLVMEGKPEMVGSHRLLIDQLCSEYETNIYLIDFK
jgi:hypothetical protein